MMKNSYIVHTALLGLTFVSLCIAGVQWTNQDPFELTNFSVGLRYAYCILAFLIAHEFGHYFAAVFHKTEVSLPYFLPFPSFLGLAPFGTLGAVIRLKGQSRERNALFDIAASGPIAGFVVSLALVCWGFATLPEKSFLYQIHPEYSTLASVPSGGLTFGYSLAFYILEKVVPPPNSFIPPMNEVYHYPMLCAGWFGLFVTGLNLLPVGQLDGGHLSYCMLPQRNKTVSIATVTALGILGSLGVTQLIWPDIQIGWVGWLLWAIILGVSLRSRIAYARVLDADLPLTRSRRTVGIFTLLIFILSFIPIPISM